MENLFVLIPFNLLKSKHIRSSAKLVFGYLRFKAVNNEWSGYINQISQDTGLSYGTIRKDLRQLSAAGLIHKEQHLKRSKDGKIRYSTWYKLLKYRRSLGTALQKIVKNSN
jgi:DNA-binding transcriptional ArsR family regulator